MHKVAARHLAAIESGWINRGTVTGIRKMVSASTRASMGWSVGGGQAKAPAEDVEKVLAALMDRAPLAVGELHAGGLAVLASKRNRRKLERVADIAPDVVTFRLVDYELQGRAGEYFAPIWRASTVDGRRFDFLNIPWQSGGDGPEVFNVHRDGKDF
jgi:hypothetical protein